MIAKTESKPKPGRPKGAKTAERAACVELPAACPACRSTRREAYKDGVVAEHPYAGEIETPDGVRPYNRVIWRRTRCLDCGQQLIVREFHFIPAAAQANEPNEEPQC